MYAVEAIHLVECRYRNYFYHFFLRLCFYENDVVEDMKRLCYSKITDLMTTKMRQGWIITAFYVIQYEKRCMMKNPNNLPNQHNSNDDDSIDSAYNSKDNPMNDQSTENVANGSDDFFVNVF